MSALPADVRALLEAVVAALDVPIADQPADDQARADLLSLRASDARITISSVLRGDGAAPAAEHLREWTTQHPVTFTSWQDRAGSYDPDDFRNDRDDEADDDSDGGA